MYGYIMFIGSVLGTLIGCSWLILSSRQVGKVKCIECSHVISTFKQVVVCPNCGATFAKRRGKIFRIK